ncbi:hypothetical protein [Enterococcus sp.]|uniref:hypothetical protein n=1 Tax=Enterococcus sp. TaxID=35783 RepID=UPI00290F540E|nr:hypothetical protein [Enterococcus sp.]MDU5337175.1 hypothetical protein [Enterococcus sp.]
MDKHIQEIIDKIKTSAFCKTIKSTIEENGNDQRTFYDKFIKGKAAEEYEHLFSDYDKFEQIIFGKKLLKDEVKEELALLMPNNNFDEVYRENIRSNIQIIKNEYNPLSLLGDNLIPLILKKAIKNNGSNKKAFYDKYIVDKTQNDYWYDYERFGKVVDGSRTLDDDLVEELRLLIPSFDELYLEAFVENLYNVTLYWHDVLGEDHSTVVDFFEEVAVSIYMGNDKDFKGSYINSIYKKNKEILQKNKGNYHFQKKLNEFFIELNK